MIEDIVINRISDKFYQINVKENESFTNLKIKLNNCYIPFGIEEYNNKYIVNFEVDNNEEFVKLVRLIEKKLNELLETNEVFELKSVFHKKSKYNLLCKSHIKKNDNSFISKYLLNNKETSIFDLKKQSKYNIDAEISGIWIYKKTYGLYINIIKISNYI